MFSGSWSSYLKNMFLTFLMLNLYFILSLIVNMLNKVGFLSSRKIIEKEKEVFDAPY